MARFKFKVETNGTARRFRDIEAAERYARAKRANGAGYITIQSLMDGWNGQRVAEIRMDNAGRIWTGVYQMEGSFI